MVRYKLQAVPRNVSFTDHAGRPAWMSWTSNGRATNDLPELVSWAFYMTSPKITYETFNGQAFKCGLDMLDNCTNIGHSSHYEFFFLPNATPEQCVAHFRAETAARSTAKAQVQEASEARQFEKQNWQKLRRSQRLNNDSREEEDRKIADALAAQARHKESYGDQAKHHQKLPGLCWPLREKGEWGSSYQGGLFMYPHGNVGWNDPVDLSREVCLVNFDPLPQVVEESDRLTFDPMEHPIHPQWMPAGQKRNEFGIAEYLQNALQWMGEFENADWRLDASGATGDAKELGWQSW